MSDRYNLFILLWGPSGCGKDYFVNKITSYKPGITVENDEIYPIAVFNKPVQYTDRPMRKTESQNNPYIFCTNYPEDDGSGLPYWDTEIARLKNEGLLLSITKFDTVRGIFRYALSYDSNSLNKNYLMAASYFQILDVFKWRFENRNKDDIKNTLIWPIFINTDTSLRLIKLYNREMAKNEIDRNFQEIVRRFVESDSVDYSNEAKVTVNSLFLKELKELGMSDQYTLDYVSIDNNYNSSSYKKLVQNIDSIWDQFTLKN